MSDLEGFDPEDIADLAARARKIEEDLLTSYELTIIISHESAIDFVNKYQHARRGDISAMYDMMVVLHTIAQSVQMALDATYDDEEDDGL